MLTGLTKVVGGVGEMLTMADKGGKGGMVTMADKGGRAVWTSQFWLT